MLRFAATVSAAVVALALSVAPTRGAEARDGSPSKVSIRAVVASLDGRPAVERGVIEAMVARADRIFAPARVSFELVEVAALDGGLPVRLETRRDRHALAAAVRPGVINLFVVASLRDVDDPARLRQGVHVRPLGPTSAVHYVIVSATAGPDVLAHELGHYFGNHRHSDTPGNIMSYIREGEPFFDEAQLRVIARHLTRFRRAGELVPR